MCIRDSLRMEKEKSYSNLALDALLKAERAEGRERQQAAGLFYGVLERKLTLDYLIEKYTRKKIAALDGEVVTALELGLYQLLYLDGVPAVSYTHLDVYKRQGSTCSNRTLQQEDD